MSEFVLNAIVLPPWAIAAQLDTVMAYPRVSARRLVALVTARCTDQIRETIKADPGQRRSLVEQFPAFNPARVRTSALGIDKVRKNALRASAVFLAMIQEPASGSPPIFQGKAVVPTQDFLVAHYWSDERQPGDTEVRYSDWIHSIEEREVRRRFPVAHICAALASLAQRRAVEGKHNQFDYQDLEILREWVMLAQVIADHICRAPNCRKIADQLIDVRWIE